jgi:hypothetical protein
MLLQVVLLGACIHRPFYCCPVAQQPARKSWTLLCVWDSRQDGKLLVMNQGNTADVLLSTYSTCPKEHFGVVPYSSVDSLLQQFSHAVTYGISAGQGLQGHTTRTHAADATALSAGVARVWATTTASTASC